MEEKKKFILSPSWKFFLLAYLLSIITMPLIIGIIGFYFLRKRHKSLRYAITDTSIRARDSKYEQNIDLIDIQDIKIDRNWFRKKLGLGSLIITTTKTKMILAGIERPDTIKELIGQAVQSLKNQAKDMVTKPKAEPNYVAGKMERINYLTGLWQQGLISDEDFENERKQFE